MPDTFVSEKSPVTVSTSQFGAYGPVAGPQVTHAAGYGTFADPALAKLSQTAGDAADANWSIRVPNHSLYGVAPAAKPGVPTKDMWFRDVGITSTEPIHEKKIWSPVFEEFERHKRWGETYHGRLAMRSVSRFIVGTAMFSAGTIYARNRLTSYNNYERPENALQSAARAVDNTAGKLIEKAVYLVTRDPVKAHNAVMFRTSRELGYLDNTGSPIKGRSLGHEAVSVTAAFATMSFGDYMTRYFIGLYDKNANTGWVKDGRLSITGGLKELGHAIFKGITYAAGEDFAAAIPYVMYTRAQSNFIDKFSPGFKKTFDRATYGAGVVLNEKGEGIGGNKLEGVIGFSGAFTVYNILTKFYRDFYARAEERLSDIRHGRKHQTVRHPDSHGIVGGIKRGLMYLAVTSSKIAFTVAPATFLFGLLRVPQTRSTGRIYFDERGEIIENAVRHRRTTSSHRPWFVTAANDGVRTVSDGLGDFYSRGLRRISEKTGFKHPNIDAFAREWADAAISYTPYFMVKADLMGPFLDTNRSNFVIAGFYSSLWSSAKALLSLNSHNIQVATGETKKWWNEVLLAMLKQPSPNFEPQIQREMENTSYKASLDAYDIYQGSKGYQVVGEDKTLSAAEIAPENTYTQRYPGRDKYVASSRSESFAERVKPKGPITQKSLVDRIMDGVSEQQNHGQR